MGLFLNTEEMRLRRLRQRVRAFVDLAGDSGLDGSVAGRWAMVTLTYADVGAWESGDIAHFIDCAKHWMQRRGQKLVYVWVAEWQKRGALHYHVLVKLPKGLTLPYPDKRGWWKRGMSSVEWVRKSGKRYMAKYTTKDSQRRGAKERGLRLCGCGGLTGYARTWFRWLLTPLYVRQECNPDSLPRRTDGGWRLADGRFIPTPYVATSVPDWGGVLITRKSVESWLHSAVDHARHQTWQLRESARRVVSGWCDVMLYATQDVWENPWEAKCN